VRRVLKYTNAFLAILLLVALGFAWRLIGRSYPSYSGEFQLDTSKAASVERDAQGIPHIKAATIEDAVYLQGYVHAQDRFWQMEATRRLAAGELSEIVGPAAIASDVEARRMRLRRIAEQTLPSMESEDRRWLAAYARGVNDWLNTHQDQLPLEIRILNYTPRQWSILDSMLLVLHMYRTLSGSWTTDADHHMMLAQGDPAKVPLLFPSRSGAEVMPGSNAWVLAGARSSTGKPILAGDPHLEQSWPSTFYINHLQAEDLDVIGGSLLGAPSVVIGHNQKIAWSMTTLQVDVQDLYLNETRLVRSEKEVIRVKGGKNVEYTGRLTPHGPLVERNGQVYALRWTAAEGKFTFPTMQLNRAKNWQEFRAALERFGGPCHNFLYADVEGNIGYQAAGSIPLRKTSQSDVPLDARNPDNDWQGLIPFEDLPRSFNPKNGLLVNSNQNPFPTDYKYPVSGGFTPPYRQRQILARLAAAEKWAPADMISIQKDVYSEFHHFLAKALVKAGASRKASREDFASALKVLEDWNGQMEIGMAAPLITSLVYEELKVVVKQRASPVALAYETNFAPAVIQKLWTERPKDWFADYDQVLVKALLDALDKGVAQQGKNPAFWDYGRYNRVFVSNLVLGEAVNIGKFLAQPWMPFASTMKELRIPFLADFVQVGPLPLSGATQTVKQVSRRVGPAFRFVADTSNWENSTFTITLGQSGHTFAPHSKDYFQDWYSGGAKALPYARYTATDTMRISPPKP
jgi:penicillin G amidase